MSLKAPFTAKDMLKLFTAAAGFSVCPVISTHDGFHICILYQHFKSRKIRFVEIFFRWLCIKLMTQSLRTGMNGKMLRTGSRFPVFAISLKTFYKSRSQLSGKIRILSVGLMSSSPSGITEDIHIRRPERQSLINIPVVLFHIFIVFRSSLCRNHLCHIMKKLCIETGCQSDRLWKNSRLSASCDPVKTFIPPVIRRYSKSFDSRRIIS